MDDTQGTQGSPDDGEQDAALAVNGPSDDSSGAEPVPAAQEQPEPFSDVEIWRAFRRPDLAIEYALSGQERLTRNLSLGRGMLGLATMLIGISLLAAVPYGAVAPGGRFWSITALYTGSLFICFPSLYVFSQFLGMPFRLAQIFVLSLLISSVAGLFTFGFFPIIWFIDATMERAGASLVTPAALSVVLLTLSLAMGVVQMARCLVARNGMGREVKEFPALMAVWLVLLLFITHRMASVLALL
jgi:hypothetical protein